MRERVERQSGYLRGIIKKKREDKQRERERERERKGDGNRKM
jgi:hypothetical protein